VAVKFDRNDAVALYRSLSGSIACFGTKRSKPEDTSHGWRDKSADVRRAHVVGWIGVSDLHTKLQAGASHENINEIKTRSAVAPNEASI
jgi:hypothetical protein